MKLSVAREEFTIKSTIGRLSIDGVFECYTLEDAVREKPGELCQRWKIPGVTAIPAGIYDVTIDFSNRFKKMMPLLLNVPCFAGVRIHSGNTSEDTEGCILVGTTKGIMTIGNSRMAFMHLFSKMVSAVEKKEKITLEVK